ncbi:PH domain-containing protein [Georgenia muralis]|uniref:PH (Pleckstrin Homology) domain-containing protein n=1 Tax=Georgenia muralis TaxID=154117 RepID=A0A3N5A282_9MICO|nr:PH domain-containing protein [Georgenia muralis]RPF25971.1 PH (Pleckstrin Homology) domain-containing protein [Georgenia muralis]
MGPTLVFRAPAAGRYAVFFWVAAALLLVAFALNGGLAEVVRFGAVPLALAVVGWVVFWRPRVTVGPDGLELANVFRTVVVPWDDVVGVETRWGLKVRTTSGRFGAWAAPAAPGRRRHDPVPDQLLDERVSGTARLVGDSSTVGSVIELGLDRRAAAGSPAAGPAGPAAGGSDLPGGPPVQGQGAGGVRVRVDVPAMGAVVASLALAALTVATLG